MSDIETITIHKKGIIEIIGNEDDSVLFLNSVPINFTWLRETGSTERFQIAMNPSESDFILDEQFRNFLKTGKPSSASLQSQFAYILNFLSYGVYSLELKTLEHMPQLAEMTYSRFGFNRGYGGVYSLIETQKSRSSELINEYLGLISSGSRPVIILIRAGKTDFVNTFILDGHHKFDAYYKLNINPVCLIISRIDNSGYSIEQGKRLIEQMTSELKNIALKSFNIKTD
jgi:hypothetical protein